MPPPSSAGPRIAFFGGSFDPPHLGHLAIARAAQQTLALDQVLFAPVGLQPLKPSGPSASFAHRAAMVSLAIASQPNFAISLLDAPDPSQTVPNYTFDTLAKLRHSSPPRSELFLLLGADSLRNLRQWHRAAELPFLANFIVATRPDEPLADLPAMLPSGIAIQPIPGQPNAYRLSNSSGQQSQLTLLPNLDYDISSTQLRDHLQAQQIPAAVLNYIHRRRLYR